LVTLVQHVLVLHRTAAIGKLICPSDEGHRYARHGMNGFGFDFRMRTPDGPMARAIASTWYARGTVPYRRERIAPTGSTVAVIVLGDPIIETAGGPGATPLRAEHGFLIGPHDRPVTNEPIGETFAVGIVTTPVGCRAALGLDPATVAGRVEELMGAWSHAADLRERLCVAPDPEAMLDLVVACLADGLDLDVPGLERCERAVAMLQEDPVQPIADVAAAVGVSHGHLDREFKRVVGLTPRRLARLLRVERLLEAIDIDGDVPWADLAAQLGWADQSHMIRDFKRHTGSAPSAYIVARRAYAAAAATEDSARFIPQPM
jgi:AraC-like DNA-binding protein